MMIKNRMIWLLFLVLQILLTIEFSLYWLCYTTLGQVLASLWIILRAKLLAKKVRIDISQGGNGEFGVKLVGRKKFAPVYLKIEYEVINLLTDDRSRNSMDFNLGLGGIRKKVLKVESPFCGKVQFKVLSVKAFDIFGLMGFQSSEGGKSSLLLLPETYSLRAEAELSSLLDPDSDAYSTVEPGQDYSQVFAIREYKEGDSIHSIHWKLTNKTDTVMVRQGSLPLKNSLLLFMETKFPLEGDQLKERSHQVVRATLSLSETLLDSGIGHHIGWWDQREKRAKLIEISDVDSLREGLGDLLSAKSVSGGSISREEYLEELKAWEFSQVVVIEDEIKGKIKLDN